MQSAGRLKGSTNEDIESRAPPAVGKFAYWALIQTWILILYKESRRKLIVKYLQRRNKKEVTFLATLCQQLPLIPCYSKNYKMIIF
jgi:hypothetical protein